MVKLFKLLKNICKNSIFLYITAGIIAISALVLLLIGTSSSSSCKLWLSCSFFIIAFCVLCVDFFFCYKAILEKMFYLLLFGGVTLAVGLTWVPGILKEREHFVLLEKKSILMNDINAAIDRAKISVPNEKTKEKKAQLENVDRLLRFPTSEDTNGDTLIKYGYTTLSKFVANTPYPRFAIAIVLSFATGLVFTLISLKSWTDKYRNFKLLLMTSAIFIIGGLPYLLSGQKAGNIVMVGFYAGLFTWVFNLHLEDIKKQYGLTGDFATSSEQADAIYRYYMRLLTFALSSFGLITIGLVFHVSSLMGDMYVLSPELRQYLFFFIICHDFYGAMILFIGVVLRLIQILEETVKVYPSKLIKREA